MFFVSSFDRELFRQMMRVIGQRPKARRYTHTCPVCGATFQSTARGRYCSAKCRQRAHRGRQAERRDQ
jgi:tRNA(Ile2) C34 agmatinyltransferase TiaS